MVQVLPNILLVEDDENVAALLSVHLRRAGYQVRHAGTIAKARALAGSAEWDLAILDRWLPDGDGLDLCQELRRASPHGYIVMLTGDETAKLQGFERGADDYVTKPYSHEELLARLRAGARIVRLQQALMDSNRRLEALSLTDSLTSLRNRRAFDERLGDAFEHSRRYDRALSLVVLDVDHFKSINDTHGHALGDMVLRIVAERIAKCSRASDFVARIGGEEFAVILPETPLFEAMQFAEKIRAHIAATPIAELHVSVSLGVANALHSRVTTTQELFNAADQALYRAKANGRNRTEMERRREPRREVWTRAEREVSAAQ